MKKSHLIGAVCAVVFSLISISSHAALTLVLGGQAVYDDVADLTWTKDANINGLMTWGEANTWAQDLTIGGVGGWRLPTTLQPDPSCYAQTSEASFGTGCTGSEMGNLYNVENVTQASPGLFSAIQYGNYWSSTEYAPDTNYALDFLFDGGVQDVGEKGTRFYAWAVQSGNVGASASVKLSALVNLVMEMNLHAGISNALDSKLSNALSAVDDDNANNDGAVLNMMYAFCSSSEAQRGKKLTNTQTDALIAAANGVIVLLDEYATPCEVTAI